MTDIVERLRVNDGEIYLPLLGQAADAIEALRQEVQDLMEELAYHGVYPK